MPIYEYRCGKCGTINEFIVISKDEKLSCKTCNSDDLTKLISAHNTVGGNSVSFKESPGGCCGSPNSCGSPGSCCAG